VRIYGQYIVDVNLIAMSNGDTWPPLQGDDLSALISLVLRNTIVGVGATGVLFAAVSRYELVYRFGPVQSGQPGV